MRINESTFTIVANGFADGPAQALRDYLISHGAIRVITVAHPLVPEGGGEHFVTTYADGKVTERVRQLPNRPPYTYGFDPFVPLRLPPCTAWFGFNNLACLRGLARRKVGRTKKVYYWAVDFVPQRFGKNPATKAYDLTDKLVCQQVDGRIELSKAALDGRAKYLSIPANRLAPGVVVPMGTWLDRTPKADSKSWHKKKVIYLGHLVERQGVAALVRALQIVMGVDKAVTADIVGGGPLSEELRMLADGLDIAGKLTFHGFVKDHRDVEKILATGTVAAAPYVEDQDSFTQFADPGKLKAYLGANLPIVLTGVPPNAHELEDAGAAILVKDSPEAIADGLQKLLGDEQKWRLAHTASAKLAQSFDWNTLLGKALSDLGYV